ncbi:hypothetical protein KR49_11825 [Synechococcus sp. KORDI-49]|nr:hypothetical protein KR49_11825 [Synechococcus sp. KORDI-49]
MQDEMCWLVGMEVTLPLVLLEKIFSTPVRGVIMQTKLQKEPYPK